MNKLWSDCSKEEKKEVREVAKECKYLKEQYLMGAISHRKYSYRITKLKKRLDEIERKYQ